MTADPGLCAGCRHARRVATRRGSLFWLCGLAETDPRFPRYPGLPVLRCSGFAPGEPKGSATTDPRDRAGQPQQHEPEDDE